MSAFADGLIFDVLFVGLYQLLFAFVAAISILPLCALSFRINYPVLLRRFAIFNLFFFCWSAVGNAAWLLFAQNRLVIADDAPVWAAFIPFGSYLLDHAAGWRDGWHLIAGTTIAQLTWIWAATAIPVWILAILSFFVYMRARAPRSGVQSA
jgi:hypothetical protein